MKRQCCQVEHGAGSVTSGGKHLTASLVRGICHCEYSVYMCDFRGVRDGNFKENGRFISRGSTGSKGILKEAGIH